MLFDFKKYICIFIFTKLIFLKKIKNNPKTHLKVFLKIFN